MIKGINKRAFIVKCKSDIFEQALFIVKPDIVTDGVSASEEAERIINEYTSVVLENGREIKSRKKRTNGLFGLLSDKKD